MRRELIITAVSLALLSGCASKKIDTVDVNSGTATENGIVDGTYVDGNKYGDYTNVDPYGDENHGNMDYDQNADYGDQLGGIQNIYFAVDQYAITPDKLPVIINNANRIQQATGRGARVKIEGHCDASGTDEYNYALGLRRAKSAKDAIVVRGVNPSSIKMISMGESSPECTSGYSSDCFAKNRRVEFKVIE